MNADSLITVTFFCAYCGEPNDTEIDPSGGANQSYTEDCQICCRPNVLSITIDEATGEAVVESEFEG